MGRTEERGLQERRHGEDAARGKPSSSLGSINIAQLVGGRRAELLLLGVGRRRRLLAPQDQLHGFTFLQRRHGVDDVFHEGIRVLEVVA